MTIHTNGYQEITIPDEATQKEVYLALGYRKNGRGRCLLRGLQAVGLAKGARLEPSPSLPDIGLFEKTPTPFTCTFFVGGKNARVLHKSPFLQIPGVTLSTWCIDLLHTWHYGPMSTYITHTIRLLLGTEIYKPTIAGLDKEESDKLSLMALKAEMWTYYKRKRSDPEWNKKGSEAMR